MATKQSSKKQASNKSDKKKQTTKKSSRKVADKRPLQVPPIVVGGGNSTIVWIRRDTNPTLIDHDSLPVTAPKPRFPDVYYCFECIGDVSIVDAKDGKGNSNGHRDMDPKKHKTEFS
jgi:hypothetical protein